MTDECDEELSLLQELPDADFATCPLTEISSLCTDCGGPADEPDASRPWMPEGVCGTCWARKATIAQGSVELPSETDAWRPSIQRIVALGPDADAKFVVEPEPHMVIIRHGQATITLEYFEPMGYSDADLVKKLSIYRAFS